MIQTLIFDFDGLILDTESPEFRVWQAIYREHGQELPAKTWGQIVGGFGASNFEPAQNLQSLVGHRLNLDNLRTRQSRESNVLVHQQSILPGVEDYLKAAQRLGLRRGLASSSTHTWVDTHLLRLGLFNSFDAIVCSEDVGGKEHTKPRPDLFLKALEAVHAHPSEAIAFEDSPNGVRGAKAAGIRVVVVPNFLTGQLKIEGGDLTLKSLADLTLEKLLAHFT